MCAAATVVDNVYCNQCMLCLIYEWGQPYTGICIKQPAQLGVSTYLLENNLQRIPVLYCFQV